MADQSAPVPAILAADHVSWTVADLEAAAAFYRDVLGARELFRMGPLDAADLPRQADGRDWMAAHLGVAEARVTLVMLAIAENLNLQLITYEKPAGRGQTPPRNCDVGGHHLALRVADVPAMGQHLAAHGCEVMEIIEIAEGPLAGKKNLYVRDPFGNSLEIVD